MAVKVTDAQGKTVKIAGRGLPGAAGSPGADGRSAYDYAVAGGYNGTEAEFQALMGTGPWIPSREKGQPNGVAALDENGILNPSQIPYTDLVESAFNIQITHPDFQATPGWGGCICRKMKDGTVYLEIHIEKVDKTSQITTGTPLTVATLPEGYRPYANICVVGFSQNKPGLLQGIIVGVDGKVTIRLLTGNGYLYSTGTMSYICK